MTETKQCTRCKNVKSVLEFGTCNATKKDGYNSWCLQCYRDTSKKNRETASGRYSLIKGRQTRFRKLGLVDKIKPFVVTREDFIEWFDSQSDNCAYCGLSLEEIHLIKDKYNKRTQQLTVDCKDNDRGYVLGNMVLCCKRCNSLKSDLLNFDEMYEFAQKYLRPKFLKIVSELKQ